MTLDPRKARGAFDQFRLDMLSNERHDPSRPMGNVAQHNVNSIIKASLVGLRSEMSPVLDRALQSLADAISKGEAFGPSRHFHDMTLRQAQAIGLWLRGESGLQERWGEVRASSQAAVAEGIGFTRDVIAKDQLDDEVVFAFLAEQYESGISEFEKHWGAAPVSLKKTPGASRTRLRAVSSPRPRRTRWRGLDGGRSQDTGGEARRALVGRWPIHPGGHLVGGHLQVPPAGAVAPRNALAGLRRHAQGRAPGVLMARHGRQCSPQRCTAPNRTPDVSRCAINARTRASTVGQLAASTLSSALPNGYCTPARK